MSIPLITKCTCISIAVNVSEHPPPTHTHTTHTHSHPTHTHTPGTTRGSAETRLVEGVRFQLIEGRTRPLLRQLETHDLSGDGLSEARQRELVLAQVEAVK